MNFILNLDQSVQNFLAASRTDFWTSIFLKVTMLGSWVVVLILTVLIISAFWFWKKREYALAFAVTVLGSQLSESILKKIFQRPRPLNAVYREDSFSFPSGHAVVSLAFYGFLMYFLWHNVADKLWRNALMLLGGVTILLVGFSRLYLGVHYLSDVLGGFIFGAIWLVIGVCLHKKTTPKI